MKLHLRTRFILVLSLGILVGGVISSFVGVWMIGRSLSTQAQNNISLDINSARLIYHDALGDLHGALRLTALDPSLREALAAGSPDRVAFWLESIRRENSLDILDLLDPAGRVLVRARAPERRGDSLAGDPVIQAVIGGRAEVSSTAVASGPELRQESDELAERALIPVPATPGATADREERGLLLKAAVAVQGEDRRPLGILYGARLLNRDERLVDAIRQAIFKGESYQGQPIGEATLCLGDVRVATKVAGPDGQPAIGTRLAPEVREHVIGRGLPWVGRATVAGHRHITAYEPIRDLSGRAVGVLALGILEKKYTDVRRDALLVFLGITLLGMLASLVAAGLMAERVTRPLYRVARAVQEVAGGNLDCKVDSDSSIREIAQLGANVNRMAQALKERDLEIKRQTEERISRSERLAIVGRLAAGVAHQINNPLGGIMLFSGLLLRRFPQECVEKDNLQRISDEARRCQRIVQGLLDFSRNREPKLEQAQLRDVVEKALQLVEHQSLFLNVQIERRHADGAPPVEVDVAQMQEVFLNLILNAVEAMNNQGRLTVTTGPDDAGPGVRVDIADTGAGISEDQLERIFEPFFTTKEVGKGTGLGLSISRGIVESHGGTIWAHNAPGGGAIFSIRLPAAGAGRREATS